MRLLVLSGSGLANLRTANKQSVQFTVFIFLFKKGDLPVFTFK